MPRIHYTVYRNSSLATTIDVIGSFSAGIGLLSLLRMLFKWGSYYFFSIPIDVLIFITMLFLGVGLKFLASTIANKKQRKEIEKMRIAEQMKRAERQKKFLTNDEKSILLTDLQQPDRSYLTHSNIMKESDDEYIIIFNNQGCYKKYIENDFSRQTIVDYFKRKLGNEVKIYFRFEQQY
ncbi:hypothetical protein [Butyrivibrio sp. LB2008]|uniref:hypothetical protein n=1 Tax=Butyrivibrio sp. LB2008 TaxID=1408305 RepID=UPI00055FDBC2|nr:hypothetical protein [Butyrivibrio sp. LB2008]